MRDDAGGRSYKTVSANEQDSLVGTTSGVMYRAFADRIVPLLIETSALQFDAGADLVMIFDTSAGELTPEAFQHWLAPDLSTLARAFPRRLGYYALGWTPAHAPSPGGSTTGPGLAWTGAGICRRALSRRENGTFLQGNFDPSSAHAHRRRSRRVDRAFRAAVQGARRGRPARLGLRPRPRRPAGNAGSERSNIRPFHQERIRMIDRALLAKYDVAVPRYTSYPTVP